jgi:hypothetical protein
MDATCSTKKCTLHTPEIANPEVAQKYAEHVADQFATSNRDVESIEPDTELNFASDSPLAQAGNGSFADQVAFLANRVAASPLIPEGKMIGYRASGTKAAPPSIPLEPNIWIDLLNFSPTVRHATRAEALLDWGQAVPGRLGVRDTLSIFGFGRDVWPGGGFTYSRGKMNDLQYLKSYLQQAANAGVRTVNLHTSFSWGLNGMGYYLFSRLAWDPSLDPVALRTEILQRTFPGVHGYMYTYFGSVDLTEDFVVITNRLNGIHGILDLASTTAANNAPIVSRLRQLKLFWHYQTLFWKLYRTEVPATQRDLALQICNLAYRLRDSRIITPQAITTYFAENAARQFGTNQANGEPDPTWVRDPDLPHTPLVWETPSDPPTPTEIETWFQADRAYHVLTHYAQAEYGTDLVPVDLPLPTGAVAKAPQYYSHLAPITVATYSYDGSRTLPIRVKNRYEGETRPPAIVTIRSQTGTVLHTYQLPADTDYHAVTFPPTVTVTAQQAYFVEIDPLTRNGVYVAGDLGAPLARVADNVYRPYPTTSMDVAVYLPLAVNAMSYVWTKQFDQYHGAASDYATAAVKPTIPHQILTPTGTLVSFKGSTDIRSPNEAIQFGVPTAQRGKIWRLQGIMPAQLWFFTVPPYYGEPSSLLVPRAVRDSDNLVIKPQPPAAACSATVACSVGYYCTQAGTCRPETDACTTNSQCPTGQECDLAISPSVAGNHCVGVPCANDSVCSVGWHCANGRCAPTCETNPQYPGCSQCENGIQDGSETDTDCGGACSPCVKGLGCSVSSDCAAGLACGTSNGECFGRGSGERACWPVQCENGVDPSECGQDTSPCGKQCGCAASASTRYIYLDDLEVRYGSGELALVATPEDLAPLRRSSALYRTCRPDAPCSEGSNCCEASDCEAGLSCASTAPGGTGSDAFMCVAK